jgi:hypothetical protein
MAGMPLNSNSVLMTVSNARKYFMIGLSMIVLRYRSGAKLFLTDRASQTWRDVIQRVEPRALTGTDPAG